MPTCCQCPRDALAEALEDALPITAPIPEEIPNTCEARRALRRAAIERDPRDAPALRPRIRNPRRNRDPCNPTMDPLTAQLSVLQSPLPNPCGRRVCKVPSVFTANSGRESIELCYNLGFIDALPSEVSQTTGRNGSSTKGLNGTGVEKRYGQLVTKSLNILQRPKLPCRQPSIFRCATDRCQATFCVEHGFNDSLPTYESRRMDAQRTRGLGGDVEGKVYDNLCVRVTRFGNSA